MKNTNTCPKCESKNILHIPGWFGLYGAGNYIPAGWTSTVEVARYLCTDCGYSEEWIDGKEYIQKLIRKYKD